MPTDSPYQTLDEEIVAYMQTVQKALQAIVQLGKARYGALTEGEVNLAGLWYEDVPMLARTAADAYGMAPGLFSGAPCDSIKLRGLEEEVRISGKFLTFLEATVAQVRAIHNAGRKTLCDWTYGITDQVIGLEALPFVPPEQKELLEQVAPLVHKVLDARSASKQATKLGKQQLRDQADAKTARVTTQLQGKELEVAVLRGAPLPAPETTLETTPPAPKRARRARRARRG